MALVSLRTLFAVVIALVVLFAPALAGAAVAARPRHDMQMMHAGHCQSMPAGATHHDRMDAKSCCMAMCGAVAVAPATPAQILPLRQQVSEFALPKAYHGLHAEIATPPPRRF